MMFVLLGETHYEGDTLLGVYSTPDAAEEAYVVFCAERYAFDGHRVVRVEIDAPADT